MSAGTRILAPGVLLGGWPRRLLRVARPLEDPALQQLLIARGLWDPDPGLVICTDASVQMTTPGSGLVARTGQPVQMTTPGSGLVARSGQPVQMTTPSLSVVVPCLGRQESLDELLAGLDGLDVLVVDDASPTPLRARNVHRLEANVGPGGARQAAWPGVSSEVVAFVDSDCRVTPAQLQRLARWFSADPGIAAVAPRVVGDTAAGSPLDLGPRGGLVAPGSPVAYVPSACLLLRASVWAEHGFDPSLRVGEDVDLVWRLVAAGHRVRYDPTVTVTHVEPRTITKRLQRRHSYGTSAAVLHARHPGDVSPLRLSPLPALVLRAGPLQAPAAGLAVGLLAARLHRVGVPLARAWGEAARLTAEAVVATASATGAYASQLAWPLLIRTWPLAPLPHLRSWWQRRPAVDPVSWIARGLLDDVAYGTGVWWGALQQRDLGCLRPTLTGVGARPSGPSRWRRRR